MISIFVKDAKRLQAIFALVIVIAVTVAAPILVPSYVAAQEGNEEDPRCAVAGYGEVTGCPPQSGISEGCGVLDPSAADPELRKWRAVACDSAEFTAASQRPAAILCTETPPPGAEADARAACDPALACTENCNLVAKYINPLIRVASALVGVGVTIAIIWGGILISSSAGDPQRFAEGKRRITIAVLVLIGYFLFYQFLNWIIPGGLGA